MDIEVLEEIEQTLHSKVYENIEDWYKHEMTKKNKKITIIHINVRTLNMVKWTLLQTYLKNFKNIEIIVLTENSLNEEQTQFFTLKNFNLFTYHRKNRKGGGVAVYVKDNIASTQIHTINFKTAENIEIILEKKNMIINAVYRPPKTNIKEFIRELRRWILHKDVEKNDHVNSMQGVLLH
uniref:Uncharacterized protein n=1 Tax=Cacopsylla melanoneura TaxID=428564 RepID=A0A8D8YXQ4_9HEMI